MVETDLGAPPEALFAEFDMQPLASASLAQVGGKGSKTTETPLPMCTTAVADGAAVTACQQSPAAVVQPRAGGPCDKVSASSLEEASSQAHTPDSCILQDRRALCEQRVRIP